MSLWNQKTTIHFLYLIGIIENDVVEKLFIASVLISPSITSAGTVNRNEKEISPTSKYKTIHFETFHWTKENEEEGKEILGGQAEPKEMESIDTTSKLMDLVKDINNIYKQNNIMIKRVRDADVEKETRNMSTKGSRSNSLAAKGIKRSTSRFCSIHPTTGHHSSSTNVTLRTD